MAALVQNARFIPSACILTLAGATAAAAQCPPFELARTTEPTAIDESFATAIDFDGAFMIAAATSALPSGAAYIFRKEVDPQGVVTWVLEQRIIAGAPATNDNFGTSVSISGETAVVGTNTFNHPEVGAAFVFIRQPDGVGGFEWVQQQELVPSDGVDGFFFGFDVTIEGDRIAVGAPRATVTGVGGIPGAVYIFERSGTVWTQIDKISASNKANGDLFGSSVDLEGDRLAVGAIGKAGIILLFTVIVGAGAAYVFDRVPDGIGGFVWQEQDMLLAPTPVEFARLGQDVAIDGNVVVAGAHFENVGGTLGIGAIYIYELDAGGTWPFAARFDPLDFANPGELRSFGRALDMDAGNLVIGAQGSNVFGDFNGAAILFQKPAATWEHVVTFRGSDTDVAVNHSFGAGISVVAGEAMISALGAFETGQPRLGAVYHLKLNPDPLLLTQHPSNALVLAGSPAVMNVVASGEGALNFQWSKNGAALVDGPNISGSTTDTLSITSVGASDIGAYDCAVTNSCGTLISTPAAVSFTAGSCAGDADGSGAVNFTDITSVVANWGNICP